MADGGYGIGIGGMWWSDTAVLSKRKRNEEIEKKNRSLRCVTS
jgi:hypothetical protein